MIGVNPNYRTADVSLVGATFAFVMVASSFVDLPRVITLGPVTFLAALTVLYAGSSWMLWLARPVLTRPAMWSVALFAAFLCWAASSFLLYAPTISGIQNLLVISAFLGFVVLATAEGYSNPKAAGYVLKTLKRTVWIAAGLYGVGVLLGGLGNYTVLGPRPFALFALLGVAAYLAAWRYGSQKSLWWATGLALMIGASLSRLALIVAVLLFTLAQMRLGSVWGWVRIVLLIAVTAGLVTLALTYVEPLRARFFEGDLSFRVGGIPINASGRAEFWEATLTSYVQSPWLGQGAGSSEEAITRLFGEVGHPHNDYLRILHDFGLIGLVLWVLAFGSLLGVTFKSWVGADRQGDPDAELYLAAFLALIVLAVTMITDNVIVYVFVMAPLGILVGTALGRAGRRKR